MNISDSTSSIAVANTNEYTLESVAKVSVIDKTQGIAKVILSNKYQPPCYEILIDQKPVYFYPLFYSNNVAQIIFHYSNKITFEMYDDGLVQITEEDPKGVTRIYVDREMDKKGIRQVYFNNPPIRIKRSEYWLMVVAFVATAVFLTNKGVR